MNLKLQRTPSNHGRENPDVTATSSNFSFDLIVCVRCFLLLHFLEIMLTPVHALSTRFFYPIGNTPAVSLTGHQPPDKGTSDILLLGCGDIRNILYTVFCNQTGAHARFQ